jgi:UDP-N-acetylglucosamine--N-acetylmuramyl-(pentapeptide) pyrophosphoryl-undecaprenol N-acetylglucosamine transferase
MTPVTKPHVLLAGGGTGGHVFPALAVGEELARRGCAVSFAGGGGFEAKLVPERGLPFHRLPARPVLGRSIGSKIAALVTVFRGAMAARRIIRRERVDAVLGTGGYASIPGVVGGFLAGKPVLLLEPNARPGFANRSVSRWAAGAAVAFEEACEHFRCPCRVTGVPVRPEFFDVPDAVPNPEPPHPVRLLVLGGSQGALSLNLAMPLVLGEFLSDPALAGKLTVVHQTGAAHLEATREAYEKAGVDTRRATLVPFIEDMAGAMAAADLLISRAGALTVSEIAASGRAAVFVPLALAEGHQRDNARALEAAGGARVVVAPHEAEPLAEALRPVLEELLADPQGLCAMGGACRSSARAGATAAIADWLLELAGTEAHSDRRPQSGATSAGSAGLGGRA